jgi:signal transduction histidine kinase
MSNVVDIEPCRRARRLRIGIAAVVIAVIVSMWAEVTISINQSRDAALKDMELTAANLAFAVDVEVTRTLDSIAQTIDAVANRVRDQESDTNIYELSRQFPIVAGPIANVGLIAPNGMLIGEANSPHPKRIDLSGDESFRVHLDGKFKGLFIGRPTNNRIDDQILIPITKRVETRNGHFLGVLVFFVSPVKLTSLHKSLDLGDNGTITLIGAQGAVLSRFSKKSPDGLDGIGPSIAEGITPEATPKGSQGTYVERSAGDEVKRLFSYRRGAAYPLVVSVGLAFDEGLALARVHAETISALAAVATLLLGGLAFYLIREIQNRAVRDTELAAERRKLHAANVELQSANAELSESKQIAEFASQAKSLFLANMSHELRTPLNAIIGFSQIIKDHAMGPGKPVYADYAKDIFSAGEHLLEIINNLLDIAKIEAGKTEIRDELIDLSEILAASRAAVRVQAEAKKIGLVIDIPRGIPRVRGDSLRLRQVLINLLSNAVKFTEAGQVTVTVACDAARGLTIAVADTGIGMSPDEIAIAVEPFGQVENAITKKYQGTGLGLSIARRLVELHSGGLTIKSAKGMGTTVTIELPAERLVLSLAEVDAVGAPRELRRPRRAQGLA